LAQIVFFTAFALTGRSAIVASVVGAIVAIAYVYRLQEEERMMVAHTGAAYERYRASSRRLVPFIW
jgi:protein-S-isoprenylcysteine O-methyltransferase Ste14